jgi:hypothetical protein
MTNRPPSHKLDFYDYTLWLATTLAQWRWLRRKFGKTVLSKTPDALGSTTSVINQETLRRHYVVWVDLGKTGRGQHFVDTCAHEANHVVKAILRDINETGSLEEVDSYMVGWVTAWLWRTALEAVPEETEPQTI